MISCSWIGLYICGWQATVPKRTFAPKRYGVRDGIRKLRKMRSCIICTFQQKYKGKGCTNPCYLVAQATKFRTVRWHLIFSAQLLQFRSLDLKKCISTRAPSTKRQITLRFRGYSNNCVPSAWILFNVNRMAPIRWLLEFWKICGYL